MRTTIMKTNSFIHLHNIGSIHRSRTWRDNFLQKNQNRLAKMIL
jgi:hypothetical protein